MALAGVAYIELRAKLEQFERDLESAEAKSKQTSDSITKRMSAFGNKAQAVGRKLSTRLTLPIIAVGGAAVNAASDLAESMSKVDVVFGDSARQIQNWSKTSATAMGISRQEALESAGTFGNLFTAMKIGAPEATKMSKRMVELASDLASFNNADPSEVLVNLRAGLVGEAEPLRKFGIQLSAARIAEEALRLGLVKQGEELSAAAKSQAAYSIILKDTETAQGDFARTADGVANKQRIATAQFKDAAATLGTQLLPIGQKILGWIGSMATKFNALSPKTQKFILILAGIAAAAGPVVAAIGAISTAIAFLAANPIVLVIAAIVGLTVLIVKNWNKIKEVTQRVWNAIGDAISGVWEWIKNAASNAASFVIGQVDRMLGPIDEIIGKIAQIGGKIIGGASDAIGGAVDFLNPFDGGKAAGGPVRPRRTYLVGERGPELLQMGNSGGNIVPNHALGGQNVFNITLDKVTTTRTVRSTGRRMDILLGVS